MMQHIKKLYDLNKLYDFKSHIKNTNNINKAGLSSACLLTIIALFAILPFVPHMDGAEAAKTYTASETIISVTTGDGSAKLNLVPGTTSGVFASSSSAEEAKFSVTTNSHTGYTLSVTAEDDENPGQLVSDDSINETKFDTIDGILSESTFRDNSMYNGHWGFKPNKYVSGTEVIENTGTGKPNNYLPSPTASSAVTLDITNRANNTNDPNEYTIALGARANNSFQYGTYKKTFKLVAVGNPATYAITFKDNSGDSSVTGIPDAIIGKASSSQDDSITLPDTIPSRNEYLFKGWCSKQTTNTPDGTVCPNDADVYNKGGEFYFDMTSDNVQELYAIWGLESYKLTVTFAGEGVENVKVCTVAGDCSGNDLMGTVTESGGYVENLITGRSYYLYPNFHVLDTIDNWTKTSISGTLSSTTDLNPTFTMGNTDASVEITSRNMTMQEFGNLGIQQKLGIINLMQTGTDYILKDTRDEEEYIVAKLADDNVWMKDNLRLGSTTDAIQLTPSDSNIESDFTLPTSSNSFNSGAAVNADYKNTTTTSYGTGSGKIGVYYNYCAASAGTHCSSTAFGNTGYDVCPVGWRMPTMANESGEGGGDYETLYNAYQQNATEYNNNLSTLLSGYFSGSQKQTDRGYFWSSTSALTTSSGSGSPHMRYINTLPNQVNVYGTSFSNGNSIRCILNINPIEEKFSVNTMQDFGSLSVAEKDEALDLMQVRKKYTFVDSRDGEVYSVAKLGDGRVWMIDNLRLGGDTSINLTPADTNITSNWTLPYSRVVCFSESSCFGTDGTSGNGYTIPAVNADSKNDTATSYGPGSRKKGNFYNICAASAGTRCTEVSGNNVTQDICPAGWRLPTVMELDSLISTYSEYKYFLQSAFSGLYTGHFYDALVVGGFMMNWWSSNSYNGSGNWWQMWSSNSSTVGAATDSSSAYNGLSIRCTLK